MACLLKIQLLADSILNTNGERNKMSEVQSDRAWVFGQVSPLVRLFIVVPVIGDFVGFFTILPILLRFVASHSKEKTVDLSILGFWVFFFFMLCYGVAAGAFMLLGAKEDTALTFGLYGGIALRFFVLFKILPWFINRV